MALVISLNFVSRDHNGISHQCEWLSVAFPRFREKVFQFPIGPDNMAARSLMEALSPNQSIVQVLSVFSLEVYNGIESTSLFPLSRIVGKIYCTGV